jgi:hypothetical protein
MRVYGRALIASGSAKVGRRKMLQSVAIYKKLSQRAGYERQRMIYDMIDTYQRLIGIEIHNGILQYAASDYAFAKQLLEQVQGRRESAEELLKVRESELAALGVITEGHPAVRPDLILLEPASAPRQKRLPCGASVEAATPITETQSAQRGSGGSGGRGPWLAAAARVKPARASKAFLPKREQPKAHQPSRDGGASPILLGLALDRRCCWPPRPR